MRQQANVQWDIIMEQQAEDIISIPVFIASNLVAFSAAQLLRCSYYGLIAAFAIAATVSVLDAVVSGVAYRRKGNVKNLAPWTEVTLGGPSYNITLFSYPTVSPSIMDYDTAKSIANNRDKLTRFGL